MRSCMVRKSRMTRTPWRSTSSPRVPSVSIDARAATPCPMSRYSMAAMRRRNAEKYPRPPGYTFNPVDLLRTIVNTR